MSEETATEKTLTQLLGDKLGKRVLFRLEKPEVVVRYKLENGRSKRYETSEPEFAAILVELAGEEGHATLKVIAPNGVRVVEAVPYVERFSKTDRGCWTLAPEG